MALERPLEAGSVGFVSQSGAIASALLSRAGDADIGFSSWMSVGNEADIGVGDCIEYLADDPDTRVICLFLETVRDPQGFGRATLAARAAGKPVLAVKAGQSPVGRLAAASHTGALAGSDDAYDAFFRRSGVIRVARLGELFPAARGLIAGGPIPGRRIGIVSMSGGMSSVLADACEQSGLDVAAFPPEVVACIREIVPTFGRAQNPVDVTAAGVARSDMVGLVVDALRQSRAVDLILVQLTTNADPAAERIALDLVRLYRNPGVPFLVGRLGSRELAPRAIGVYRDAGVAVFDWPEQLVAAAVACVRYGEPMRAGSVG
ncbi:MAG: hypothetical protein WBA31_05230 [Candidatus Dormiibacterota bacterium]